jgi:hypothetical protein
MPTSTGRRTARDCSTTKTASLRNRGSGHEQGILDFARDDIRLDAHADAERRVFGQSYANAEGARDRIAGRRDIADRAGQFPVGKCVGAQKHGLPDLNARECPLR